ncbi:hypothetical protein BHE74_00022731 [Ensete ventricosum]|nr:hypothetical protein GW17_00036921 [Ensete ventricosum]RWW69656.1 hypothetical protein BHE74_00022731 [Ensete ventricosum]RZS25703.1 hypothetical protein BHM03_00058943 [Ensete ventricosum]
MPGSRGRMDLDFDAQVQRALIHAMPQFRMDLDSHRCICVLFKIFCSSLSSTAPKLANKRMELHQRNDRHSILEQKRLTTPPPYLGLTSSNSWCVGWGLFLGSMAPGAELMMWPMQQHTSSTAK